MKEKFYLSEVVIWLLVVSVVAAISILIFGWF